MKVKCLWCGDIIENTEEHNMKYCKCGKTGLDYSECWTRISFNNDENGKEMYEVIEE